MSTRPSDRLSTALDALRGERADEIGAGIAALREALPRLSEPELRAVVEPICSLFYVDTHDRPDLAPCLDEAVDALAAAGPRLVDLLLELMRGSDIKSHLYLATTLGRIGAASIPALRRTIASESDPYSRTFALYALGKIRDPGVREALPEVFACLADPDREVRDSAARTLGKIAEAVPPGLLGERQRDEMLRGLVRALGDEQPAVRAKAIRSLGKMARLGQLTPEQERQVTAAARRILGEDDAHEWDRAFIVRREAEEALRRLASRGA